MLLTDQRNSESSSHSKEIPESILMNVAGHLLMFQRDWSGPQPKQPPNRNRAVSGLGHTLLGSLSRLYVSINIHSDK